MLTPLLGSLHWPPLTTRRGFRRLCVGGGLSQPSSCSPVPSLTPRARGAWALLPQQTSLPSPWLTPASLLLLMLRPHRESAGEFRSPWTWAEDGFILMHTSRYCLGWMEGRQQIIHGFQSIHLEVTRCTPARASLAGASHVALPDFKALKSCQVS